MDFAPKDAKIIRENEGKTPYDLLELGLSNKAYEKLLLTESSQAQAPKPKISDIPPATPAKIQPVKPSGINPVLSDYHKGTPGVSNLIQRTIIGPSGIPQKMSAAMAERLVQRNPRLYQLID